MLKNNTHLFYNFKNWSFAVKMLNFHFNILDMVNLVLVCTKENNYFSLCLNY